MAKIVTSDLAPSETVHYTFAGVEFDLGGSGKGSKKSYETDDRVLLSSAALHPWLAVEYDQADIVRGDYRETLAPEDDVLSRLNDTSNDPEVVRAAAEDLNADPDPTAIDAGKDQDEVVETGGVAETLAADNADAGDKS